MPLSPTHFVKGHTVLDEQPDPRVEKADVALEHKVALALRRYAGLELPEPLLRCGRFGHSLSTAARATTTL